MNSLCRRFVAIFLALILILPHPAFALREPQEDSAVSALERRLHSAAGLEENLTPEEIGLILSYPLERRHGNVLRLTGERDLLSILSDRDLFSDKDVLVVPGYGNFPFQLKTRGARSVIGVDIDPVTVAWQKARVLYGEDPQINHQLSQFEDPPYKPAAEKVPVDRIRDFVRTRKPPAALKGIRFKRASIQALPLPDNSADLIVVPYLFGFDHGLLSESDYELIAMNLAVGSKS